MMLARYDLNNHMSKPRDLFSNLFGDLFGDDGLWREAPFYTTTVTQYRDGPDTYRCETDDAGLRVLVDLPGVKRSDLSVEMRGTVLVITSARGGKQSTRKYTINDDYDPKTVEAGLEDGVLTVKFAKKARAPAAQVIKVDIK